jgi:hypothetical protein
MSTKSRDLSINIQSLDFLDIFLFVNLIAFHTNPMRLFLFCGFVLGLLTPLYAFPPNTVELPKPVVEKKSQPAPIVPPKATLFNPAPTHLAIRSTQTVFQLGITHLRTNGFDLLRGKRVGLLTHAAAVDEKGVSTIEILKMPLE